MGKRVLFSPVGTTDPARGGYEGPLLHILRYNQPIETIYLYLTKEMKEREESGFLYSKAIQRHADLLGYLQPGIVYMDSNSDDPSNFDAFIVDYQNAMMKIASENPASEILVNISSGTPQMIATACLLISSGYKRQKYIGVQVQNPEKTTGEKMEFMKPEEAIDVAQLYDNIESSSNRCVYPTIQVFQQVQLNEQLKSAIVNYDYNAAMELLSNPLQCFSEEVIRWIKDMNARVKFDRDAIRTFLLKEDTDKLDPYPVVHGIPGKMHDFYLTMAVKKERNELGDYLLRISPLMTELALYHIITNLKYPLGDLITISQDVRRFDRARFTYKHSALLDSLDTAYGGKGSFRSGPVTLDNLLKIMEFLLIKDATVHEDLLSAMSHVRNAESNCRNNVAHQMVHVSEAWIKSETGRSFNDLHGEVQKVMRLVLRTQLKKDWKKTHVVVKDHILALLS